ncbi:MULTISPECIES: hypothetical protein [unclassified Cryobacterium]|uniref:hypothetical protein n=1 Tax=unclassified Cryobacterium TaxID=2649013 RepID=UPI002AB551B1|nr:MULTISPECIES: hypothetical protein [unclassified Cryobacterium]MDY7542644.1 hypothetical protein [Cryobacterium sp. 5B3]MEB0264764.1 hypothetical protein [Cryobacterium sp. 10I5]MEB0273736.1 hypothetical protein [Cryobacterium sp. 5B3]
MTQTFSATDYRGLVGETSISTTEGKSIICLAGGNGVGKTSFFTSQTELFKYQGSKAIPEPIHDGQTESRAEFIDTELDLRFLRVWKVQKDGTIKSTFSVYALDGAKDTRKPMDILAELTGGNIVDPGEFVAFDEKKKRQVLLSKVELDFDPDALAAKRVGFFAGRTDVTRDRKKVENQLAGFPPLDPSLPDAEVDVAALYAERDEIREHNERVAGLSAAHTAATDTRLALEMKGRELAAELDRARAEHKAAVAAEVAAAVASAAAEVKSTDAVLERLATVDQVNVKVRAQAARAKVAADLAALDAKEADLTSKIKAIEKTEADGLAAAVFPVDGLSVDDDGVTVNGRRFESLNEAQQWLIAFDIATSGNPPLKVIFIKNGNALDDESLAQIEARGTERGWTVVTERGRDNSSEIGFVFDEGQLVSE